MKILIKPAEGKIVRRPDTKQPLNKDGELVERNSYWIRRLNDGDVTLIDAKKQGDKK